MADKSLKLAFVLSATDKMSRVIDKAINNSTSKLTAFERNTGKVSKSMLKAGGLMVGAGAAVGAATFGIAKSTANYGDQMIKTSRAVGMGAEEYQKLSYAAKYAGVEQGDLQAAMFRFSKNISQAATGTGAAAQAFKDMGIDVKDSAGNLKAPNDILSELADKFGKTEDGAAKTALAQELLGRSGAKMISLLNSGSNGIQEMGEEAVRLGMVLSEDACTASEKFNDDLSRVKDGAKGLSMQFGAALMPMLNSLVEKIISVVKKLTDWIQENPKLVKTLSKVALGISGVLLIAGTASIIIGGVVFVVGKVITVVKGVVKIINIATKVVKMFNLTLLKNPIVLIIALVAVLAVGAYFLIKHWDKVSAWFSKLWDGIKNVFSKTWEWIKKMFLNYTPYGLIIKHWSKISSWFGQLWDGVKSAFSKAWEWIKKMFLNYTPYGLIIKHWGKITGFFSNLWGSIKNTTQNTWAEIGNVFRNLNPVQWIQDAWSGVGEFFTNLGKRFFEWGQNIISSLWNGIKSIANKAVEGVKNIGNKIASEFKSIFGINSPSKLFMEYGVNITQGLVEGIGNGEGPVEGATESLAMKTMQGIGATDPVTNNSSTSNAFGGTSIVYSPNITIQGEMGAAAQQDFRRLLKDHAAEIVDIMRRENRERERLAFG